jgi:hypothetical protein
VLDTQRRFSTSLAVRRVRHKRFVSGAAGFLLSEGRPATRTKPRAMLGQMLQLIEAAGGDPALATPPLALLGPDEKDWIVAASAVPNARLPLQDAAARGIAPTPALTIALAQRLAASLANDSGGGHMLAAGDRPLVSLFGPTDPAKFAPHARHSTVLRAQDFGADRMAAIPIDAVAAALQSSMASGVPR